MSASSNSGGGIGFASALTLLFIGLKLGHVIDWPWLWVLSPMWISFCVAVVFLVIGFHRYGYRRGVPMTVSLTGGSVCTSVRITSTSARYRHS